MEWFFNRLKEGYALVRNPMNYNQVSKVLLAPSEIDCIVFWTKDPTKIAEKLDLLSEYKYYFHITINAYDKNIECNVPLKDLIIEAFKNISGKIGKDRTIWRYDPIILTNELDMAYHCKHFELLAAKLEGYASRCVISFVDQYKKTERNMKSIRQQFIDGKKMLEVGRKLSEIARRHNIKIETCSEAIDLSSLGIQHAKCVDDRLISEITGQKIKIAKDKNQREICGCVASVDIGAYNTCRHGCLYCYANHSDTSVKNNLLKHDCNSPMLIGNAGPEDNITIRI
jgi:DNA repair photolyase